MQLNTYMFKIHVISDLRLGFNEFADPVDETIPDVDLVVIAGNIGKAKRSALYVETLAKKYPDIQFIWLWGESELYFPGMPKFMGELEDSMKVRVKNTDFPKNIHWCHDDRMFVTLRTGQEIDVFCSYGFPRIMSYTGDWEDTHWFKYYAVEMQYDTLDFAFKPKETSNVQHGPVPVWATKEWINATHDRMWEKIRVWEREYTGFKLLVTHINPYRDTRCENQVVTPYRIHLNNMAWVTSDTPTYVNFLGGKLIANPGRGIDCRSKVYEVDTGQLF